MRALHTSPFRKPVLHSIGVSFNVLFGLYVSPYPSILLINLYNLQNFNNPLHFQAENPQATKAFQTPLSVSPFPQILFLTIPNGREKPILYSLGTSNPTRSLYCYRCHELLRHATQPPCRHQSILMMRTQRLCSSCGDTISRMTIIGKLGARTCGPGPYPR